MLEGWGGLEISTHALREEGDVVLSLSFPDVHKFLPTPSARRATGASLCLDECAQAISTHALREEGDYLSDNNYTWSSNISTHALREEGDNAAEIAKHAKQLISTHALREEGDVQNPRYPIDTTDFYPRPPRGGRPSRFILYFQMV